MFNKAEKYEEMSDTYIVKAQGVMWMASIIGTATFYHWFFVRDIYNPTYTLMLVSTIVLALMFGHFEHKARFYSDEGSRYSSKQEEWANKRYEEILYAERRERYTDEQMETFYGQTTLKPKVTVVPSQTKNVYAFPSKKK